MNGYQRWFGWIAIGLGALALLVTLAARWFGPQIAAGMGGANWPQAYTQPGASAQQGAAQPGGSASQGSVPGGNVQPGTVQQPIGPQSGTQAQHGGQRGNDTRQGMPGAGRRSGSGGPGDAGFGRGGWFSFPFRWLGGLFRMALPVLLIVLGVWLIRGHSRANAASSSQAVPAQGLPPTSPTGEVYTDTPDEHM